MHAEAVALHRILNFNLQMVIPIFQRSYSWEKEQVRTLWDDIIKLYSNIDKDDKATHFLGPIVRVDVPTSSVDTRKLYLIDGQQRIATLMVLLTCLRNIFKEKNEEIRRKIEYGYLLNEQESGENRFKLILSEADREIFRKIIISEKNIENSKLKDTYDFFTKKLESLEDELDLEKLRGIIINKLILVSIDADRQENPYLIFESLNAKGTLLTQADLIRNYIFMKIASEDKQKELYKEYWRPMEVLLGDELETFFWRYTLKDGTFVKIKRTYADLKSELETNSEEDVEGELKKLHEYSIYYSRLLNPEKEPEEELRKRFIRLNKWEIRTAYPLLLNLYKDYSDGKVSHEQFSDILDIIESFVIRRFFCTYPTNKLNNLFISIYNHSQIDKNRFADSLKEVLKKDWPDDESFKDGIKTKPLYKSGYNKCSLILESIEESHQHKEPPKFDKIQIEHIMPQVDDDPEKLPDEWKTILGPNYSTIHSLYLHTLGNLTLTGYNPELSKKSFAEKKKILESSHFELNKYFREPDTWNEKEILNRAEHLAKKAISIWKREV